MPKKQLITLSLETEVYDWYNEAASALGITVPELISHAAKKYKDDIQSISKEEWELLALQDAYGNTGSGPDDFIRDGNERGWPKDE